jgi:hypothetical protein
MTVSLTIPDNDSIQWDATRFGLLPILSVETEQVIQRGEAPVPVLLEALLDPQHFVAAHVLLTRITGVRFETFPTWNGLTVEIRADGSVNIESEQRHQLSRRWHVYFQTEPKPDMLPA